MLYSLSTGYVRILLNLDLNIGLRFFLYTLYIRECNLHACNMFVRKMLVIVQGINLLGNNRNE